MREDSQKKLLFYCGVSASAFFILTPVLFMILTGLSRRPDFLDGPVSFTIGNFSELLSRSSSTHFPDYLLNSGIISAASALVSTIIAGFGAYAFTRFSFPGRMILSVAILALSMFPQISIVGYLFRLTAAVGLTNTRTGLIIPYTAWVLPLSMWILISYLKQVPRDLDKAAHIDGCTPLQTIRYVILPIAAPGLFSTLLLSFIFAFNEFMFALILTSDHHARTIPVGISLFQGLHGEIPWGSIMAASTLATAPIVALALFFQKYIIQGLTRGAIKE